MVDEPRTTYDTQWYDVPVTCCSACHFIQLDDGLPNHADWCEREAAEEAS